MLNKLFFISFIIALTFGNNFKKEFFNQYSILNIENQNSDYSISIVSSQNSKLNYSVSWKPSTNLIINSKLKFNNRPDSKIFHSLSLGILTDYNFIFGLNINAIKYDNKFNDRIWNSYFFVKETKFKSFQISTSLTYNYNENFNLITISNYMKKYINDFFEIGFGFDLTKLNTLKYKSYLGIRLNL